jgi:hypothetical protein
MNVVRSLVPRLFCSLGALVAAGGLGCDDGEAPQPPAPKALADCPEFGDAVVSGVDDSVFVDVDAVAVSLAGLELFARDLVLWMLDRRDDGSDVVAAADAATGPYATAVFAAFASGSLDATVLEAGLARFYSCARSVPVDVDALVAAGVEFDGVDEEVASAVKGATRRIYRSSLAGAFVAQTVKDGVIVETEALLTDRRRDGSFDIVTYNAEGERTATSAFAAPCAARAGLSACTPRDADRVPVEGGVDVVAPAPLSCLRCHHSTDGGFFDVTPAP